MDEIKNNQIKNEFYDVIERLKTMFCVKTNVEIAEKLNITGPAYAERVRRKSLPYEKIIEACAKNGFDLDYVFGLKTDFTPIQHFDTQAVHITKYTKGYSAFGDSSCAEPFIFNNAYCADEHAKFSAVVADSVLMFPVIDINDTVIVNENKHDISEDGKLFLVKYKNNISVARLFKTIEPDDIIMKFESPSVKDTEVKLKNLTILGKVVSVHRSM